MAKWKIIEDNKFKKGKGGKTSATRAVTTKNSKNNPKMLSEVTVVEPKTVTKNKPVIQKPNVPSNTNIPAQDATRVNQPYYEKKVITNPNIVSYKPEQSSTKTDNSTEKNSQSNSALNSTKRTATSKYKPIQKPTYTYIAEKDKTKANVPVNERQVIDNQPTQTLEPTPNPTPLINLSNANSYNIPNLTGSDSLYYGVPYKNGEIADKKLWNKNKILAEEEVKKGYLESAKTAVDIGQTAASAMELFPLTAPAGFVLNAGLTVPSLAIDYYDKNYVGIGADVAGLVPSSLLPGGYGTAKTIGEIGYNAYNVYDDVKDIGKQKDTYQQYKKIPINQNFKQIGGKVSGWEIIDDIPKAQNGLLTKIKSTLNPLNIGVPDYTDKYKTWNEAYSAAKKAGLSEIMWNKGPNPGRKNLDYAGTPAQEMKSYGITGEQRVFNPSTARKNLGRLDTEKGYDTELSQVFKQLFDSKNSAVVNNEEPAYGIEKDAFRLYLGLPQEMNSFTPSKYKKGAFEIVNYNQMLPEVLDENIENLIKTKGNPEKEFKYGEHITGGNSPIKPYGDIVMGKHTVKKGKDDKGEYIEYADKWDLDSYKVGNVAVGQIADMVNKPLPIYGRVYYKDYGDGVKRKMYYSDNELKSFSTDKNNKNFNALDLQKELVNRGYELPNSMQQDDYGNINFDGIYGNETKQALQDFQSKKTPAPKMAVSLPGQSTALPPELKHGGKVSGWQIIDDVSKAEKGLAVGERKILQRPTQPLQEKSVIKSIPTTVKPQYKSEGDYLNQVYGEDSGVQLPGQSSILRASQDAKPAYDVAKQDYSSYNKEIQEQKTDEQVAKFLKANPLPESKSDKADYIENLSPYDRQLIQSSSFSNQFLPAFRQYENRVGENAKKYSLKEAFSDPDKASEVAQLGLNRFRLFPNATNSYEDLINPGIWFGQMEQGVADIPKNIRDENYLGAAMGVVNPLAMGALGAAGSKSTGQWLNNMANPLAGIVDANTLKGLGNKALNKYAGKSFTPELGNVGVEALGVGKQNIGSSVEGVENNLVTQLRKELEEKGIIGSQKTINFPWKEPIRKGVEPWIYGDSTLPDDAVLGSNLSTITGSKFKDVIGSIIGGKNPRYLSDKEYLMKYGNYDVKLKAKNLSIKEGENPIYDEDMQEFLKEKPALLNEKNIKDAINLRDKNRLTGNDMTGKNRYATWDMYLGKPQTQHPMYDISELTKSKKDIVYTIKEDFINKPEIQTKLKGFIESMERDLPGKEWTKKGDSWIIPDDDKDLFGTMGGFHWKVDKLNNGNYKIIANDVWDLQPLKTTGIPFIKNIEVGKALGIGKPMNVKVGFEIDGNTKKIIKTFNLGGAVLGASALQQKKHGGIIEDPMGQWAHPGSVTRIPSNQITMQGVNYPVLGVSDRGHTQMMYPGEDYSFRGKSVTEYPMMGSGGEVNFTYAGENHRVYEKESPTGNGKGIEGHIMVNHPTENKGKWDTIDLTKITNGRVKTVAQGVASTKKWHKENPEYADGGMIKRADGSYSKRGLWDNIRDNAGSGKKPTKEMLKQERKIKSQYANGGKVSSWEIIEDLPKAGNGLISEITSTLNPKNWGVKDYTKSGTRDQAYAAARKAGEKEFMWNNERFSTDMAGTPAQQLKWSGITNEQLQNKGFISNRLIQNLNPRGYGNPVNRVYKAVVKNEKDFRRDTEGEARMDAYNLYMGIPQKNNTFEISKYSPSVSKDKNIIYYKKSDNANTRNSKTIGQEKYSDYMLDFVGDDGKIKSHKFDYDEIAGNYTINLGKDDNGNYISYYDKWDLNPFKLKNPITGKEVTTDIGKPFEFYDRIYYRDNPKYSKEYLEKQNKMRKDLDLINSLFSQDGELTSTQIPGTFDYKYTKKNGQQWEIPKEFKGIYDYQHYLDEELIKEKEKKYIQQYYSNKELSTLDVNKKDFDILALQRELSNRGYNLPKSTKPDGTFDGVLGDETKKALQDFQNKKVEAPKMAVQKPGQSEALPPQFKKGGKTKKSNWQIIEY